MPLVSSSMLDNPMAKVEEVAIQMGTKTQEMAIQILEEIDTVETPLQMMILSKDLPADFRLDTQMVSWNDSVSSILNSKNNQSSTAHTWIVPWIKNKLQICSKPLEMSKSSTCSKIRTNFSEAAASSSTWLVAKRWRRSST